MKINPLLTKVNASTFIEDYLQANGIDDTEAYLDPDLIEYQPPNDYPNMLDAVNILMDLNTDARIGILQDCDFDGVASAAIIYDYVVTYAGFDNKPIMFFHNAKQHGLRVGPDENMIEQVKEANLDLLIIPDAGSNDADEINELLATGMAVIVLDHHEIETLPSGERCAVVNPNLSDTCNHAISGTGVAYKFIEACQDWLEQYSTIENWPVYLGNRYKDLVAVSLISDVCDFANLENRKFLYEGLKMLQEDDAEVTWFLKLLCQSFNRRGNTPEGFSFGLIPPINALCRSNDQEAKRMFFNCMVGEIDNEEVFENGIDILKKAHKEQLAIVKTMVGDIEPELDTTHTVTVGFTSAEHKTYIGLVANKFCSSTRKPTLLLREKNATTWSGSLRSPIEIASIINETGLAKAQGHEEAAGIEIPKDNLDSLIQWFDGLELDTDPDIIVAAELEPKQVGTRLCRACAENENLWGAGRGTGLPAPLFYIKAHVRAEDISIFKKRTTTIKFHAANADFIKFQAKNSDVDALTEYLEYDITMLVKLSLNDYMGQVTPQGLIQAYEITPCENSWEDMF